VGIYEFAMDTFTAAVVVFGGDQEHGYGAVQFLFDGERTERPVELSMRPPAPRSAH
jgi:hypothetical protein